MNVEALDRQGRRLRMLCFMPKGHLPLGDTMLGQKIALELFETEVLRIANAQVAWDDFYERPRAPRRVRSRCGIPAEDC